MPDGVFRLGGRTSGARLKPAGGERSSMFIKRGRALEFVKSGSLFHRTRPDKSVETARIIGMRTDSFGIAHVRYEVSIFKRQRASAYFDGPRTLALAAFTATYHDRAPAY